MTRDGQQKPENRSRQRAAAPHSPVADVDPAAAQSSVDDLPDIIEIVLAMGQSGGGDEGNTAAPGKTDETLRAGPRPFGPSQPFGKAPDTLKGASDAHGAASAKPNHWLSTGNVEHTPVPTVGEAPLPAHLETLAERARSYVEAASSVNTRRAYAADWKHFCAWARRQNLDVLPPDPQTVGLYITALASGGAGGPASREKNKNKKTVATIERRLSALAWNYAQRGQPLDRKDRHIATVMAGIRNSHAAPPVQKEANLPEDLIAMLETLDRGTLRGLRDRAMLLLGFAGGLRRSEIVALDCQREQTEDGAGWIEIFPGKGILVTLRGKTGWREVEIGRGSSDATCPVVALDTWLKFAKIGHGPLFRRVTGQGRKVGPDRLNAQEVARLVKRAALAAGVRGDLSEGERAQKFSGHSLRAGLASSAEVDERYVQKQLGHASAEMTRKYQRRRDRFRVNLTKASGL